jgi:hypothetical protein
MLGRGLWRTAGGTLDIALYALFLNVYSEWSLKRTVLFVQELKLSLHDNELSSLYHKGIRTRTLFSLLLMYIVRVGKYRAVSLTEKKMLHVLNW